MALLEAPGFVMAETCIDDCINCDWSGTGPVFHIQVCDGVAQKGVTQGDCNCKGRIRCILIWTATSTLSTRLESAFPYACFVCLSYCAVCVLWPPRPQTLMKPQLLTPSWACWGGRRPCGGPSGWRSGTWPRRRRQSRRQSRSCGP